MKGHTKIELFNAKTGELEKSYEKDNLVTNAVKYLIAWQTMAGRTMNESVFPIAKNALGGLLLFDNTLTEDADNIAFPSDAKLVGYAARDTNTSDSMRGSLNSLETHKTDTGYVSVWDFGTSQANGTIKAVALTNRYGGANPFQRQLYLDNPNDVDVNASVEHNSRVFLVKDEEVYWLRPDGKTIQKCRFDPYRVKIADQTYGSVSESATTVVALDLPTYEGFNIENSYKYWLVGDDGYLYLITQNNRINTYTYYGNTYHDYHYDEANKDGDAKIYITKYKLSDLSFDRQEEVVLTLSGVHLVSRSEGSMVLSNGDLYARGYDNRTIYIVNLSNAANIQTFTCGNSGSLTNLSPILYGDGIEYQYNYTVDGTTYTRCGFLFHDGTYSEETTTGGAVSLPVICHVDDKILCTYHYDGYYDNDRIRTTYRACYLGTINNLSSPVTKNASQTMKITYTLTDKEESDETV